MGKTAGSPMLYERDKQKQLTLQPSKIMDAYNDVLEHSEKIKLSSVASEPDNCKRSF